MIKNRFKNIYPDEKTQLDFYNTYRRICQDTGCYYMGYMLEDSSNNFRLSFTTNLDWGKEYIENYIDDCHLWNTVQCFFNQKKNGSLILPWSTVPISNKRQCDILLRRRETFIGDDGISFCKQNNNYKEYYYFAPDKNQRKFIKHISNNIDSIRSGINNLRNQSLITINKENIKNDFKIKI